MAHYLAYIPSSGWAGWTAYVFTSNAELARQLGLTPVERVPLFNGKIRCQLLRFDLLRNPLSASGE